MARRRPQEPNTNVTHGTALDGLAPHHFDVVQVFLTANLQPQRADGSDLEPPMAFDQTSRPAHVDDARAKLARQDSRVIAQFTCSSAGSAAPDLLFKQDWRQLVAVAAEFGDACRRR